MSGPDEPAPSVAEFDTTSWSLIVRAQSSSEDLDKLLRIYWSPVYAFLRRKGKGPHDAADLTQEFLSRVVLQRDLIGKADPSRGRFRTFLLTAVRNFLIDEHRRENSRRAAPGGDKHKIQPFVPEDERVLSLANPKGEDDPATAFDRQWATTVLHLTFERVRKECLESGLEPHWQAFETNIAGPAISSTEAIPLDELARRIGAEGPEQVSSMIQTVKRRFRRRLRHVVAETVDAPEDLEEEMTLLLRFLES